MESNKVESCSYNVIHGDVITKVRDNLPSDETLYDLAELFKVFGDTTRVKILCALYESEMCVCDLSILLNVTQSAISHHQSSVQQLWLRRMNFHQRLQR